MRNVKATSNFAHRTPQADALTGVILAIFRANGRLLAAGDALVEHLGLTSARWQVLGAIALASTPLTAPQVADAMGLTRQGVQKQLHALVAGGLLERSANPGHKRSPLYALSARGEKLYRAADALQEEWANQLARGFSLKELEATSRSLNLLAERLINRGDR